MINESLSLAEELALHRQTSEGNGRGSKVSAFSRFLSITDEEEEKHFTIQKEVCYMYLCDLWYNRKLTRFFEYLFDSQ